MGVYCGGEARAIAFRSPNRNSDGIGANGTKLICICVCSCIYIGVIYLCMNLLRCESLLLGFLSIWLVLQVKDVRRTLLFSLCSNQFWSADLCVEILDNGIYVIDVQGSDIT